jgi:hypothetical protein
MLIGAWVIDCLLSDCVSVGKLADCRMNRFELLRLALATTVACAPVTTPVVFTPTMAQGAMATKIRWPD